MAQGEDKRYDVTTWDEIADRLPVGEPGGFLEAIRDAIRETPNRELDRAMNPEPLYVPQWYWDALLDAAGGEAELQNLARSFGYSGIQTIRPTYKVAISQSTYHPNRAERRKARRRPSGDYP